MRIADWLLTGCCVWTVAVAGAEFHSEARAYRWEIPDAWHPVAPAALDELAAAGGNREELAALAADPAVDYFMIGFERAYADNLNVTGMSGQPLPSAAEIERFSLQFCQVYEDAYGTGVDFVEAADEALPDDRRVLRIRLHLPEPGLTLEQRIVETGPREQLNFTLTARDTGFEAAAAALTAALATLQLDADATAGASDAGAGAGAGVSDAGAGASEAGDGAGTASAD